MAQVLVYTTNACAYCGAAKSLLKKKGIAFEELDVSGDFAKRDWLVEKTGQRTVPQIFIGGVSIGGYAELSALERAGKLDGMLAAAS